MTMTKVAKSVPKVKFAECKKHPGTYQFWVVNCFIYSTCKACGTSCSFDRTGTHDDYKDHYNFYEIPLKKLAKEDWEVYWTRAEKLVAANPAKYAIADQ